MAAKSEIFLTVRACTLPESLARFRSSFGVFVGQTEFQLGHKTKLIGARFAMKVKLLIRTMPQKRSLPC